ncbi:phage terminase large subunit-like protein [Melghiribacillus thermohalophilus]|uniref:Phage terminase large subunit-like protein n=1 Tax=Melghiribacillus thermohalophilus TaxID=1324956 RepID=A0A4R3N8F4_9BACI|nr:terminase TerL endonuclease subunit [Melghiribacillus thermohalophilus]TCT23383.1 phage terminase large subunit-like protein [Melghiribacillus thermohalophilus]
MIKYPLDHNPIIEYWEKIEGGEEVVSNKVRRVYQKLVNDLNDENSEWEYSPKRANHAIEFIENYCKHSKGKQGGKPFILELWQKAIVAAIFGFVHKIDGTRKYQELILIVARKNGKSTFASGIALYMLAADGEAGPEVVSAATKKDQAKIIWSESKRMVRKSPSLRKRIRTLVHELVSDFNDGTFKPLSSDSNTLDGLNVHCSLIDELHAIEDKNLYDVIVDGMSAREQPLSIITSTAGTVREGIFDIKYEEAEQIINGYDDPEGYKDERVLPIIYELDKRQEWTDEKAWKKANPGLGTIKSFKQLKAKVEKAKKNPLLVKNLLTKDFNIRETSSESWLTFEQLNNQEKFDIETLKPRYAIGGTDLSKTTDLTSACILFMFPGDDRVYFEHMYWLPEDLLEKRTKEDKIPYDIWYEQGLLRTTPGNSVHPKHVTEWYLEIMNEKEIYLPWIGYDGWSAEYWVEEMEGYFGKEAMIKVIQGKKTLSSPMMKLGADLEAKKVIYNNNPITKWCLSNTSVDIDKNGNIQPIKTNQRRRIDGLAAMLNAYVVLQQKLNDYQNMI